LLVVGTYYGQWMQGLRHGYGVRQSAPFSVATPVRQVDDKLSSSGRRPRHHNSLPVLNASSSLSPADAVSMLTTGDTEPSGRGRSGFVLRGERDRDSESVRVAPRSRSASVRRRIADSFSSLNPRKRKSWETKPNDTSQVSSYVTMS